MEPRPGDIVADRYVIERMLGRGGMGTVWKVRHAALGTSHALKVLRGTQGRERLLREGRLQGRLRHPHVVALTDVLELPDSVALVLEYVDGGTLSDLLREGPAELELLDRLAAEILAGVAEAHGLGFVHRDLKPANVLLTRELAAKVGDFGLAVEPDADDRRTLTGAALGTPAYMSPEQIRDTKRVDARSDVWSLGVLLHELATGQLLFREGDRFATFHAIVSGRIPALSESRPELPDRIHAAVAAALRVDAAERPADARELLARWSGAAAVPRPAPRPAPILRSRAPEPAETWSDDDVPAAPVPPEVGAFVGRAEALADLDRRFDAGERALLVTGAPGIGKSRFATHAAHRWAGPRRRPTFYLDVSALPGVEAAAAEIGRLCGASAPTPASLGTTLARRPPTLWVLDQADGAPDLPEALARWAAAAPTQRFLVTLRASDAELPRIALRTLSAAEGAALLRARLTEAGAADPPPAEVDAVVARLDGLPAALELAAVRAREVPLGQLAARLDEAAGLLGGASAGALRASLDAALAARSPAARRAWARLSVFAGPFDEAAALDVVGDDAPEALRELAGAALLRALPGGRHVLLATFREHADGLLTGAERTDAEARHGRRFAGMDRGSELLTTRLADYTAAVPDLVAAVRRAVARGDAATAVGGLCAVWRALGRVGPYPLAAELATAVAALPLDDGARARTLAILGTAQHFLGRTDHAVTVLTEAGRLAGAAGDAALRASVLASLGTTHRKAGRHDDALAAYEASMALGAGRDDAESAADLNGYGTLLWSLRRYGDAEAAWLEALERAQRHGVDDLATVVLRNLGFAAFREDRPEEARAWANEGLAAALRSKDLRAEALLTQDLGNLDFASGDDARALARFRHARDRYQRVGDARGEAIAGIALGEVALLLGDPEEGRRAAVRALAAARLDPLQAIEGLALGLVGLVRARAGDALGARSAAADARAAITPEARPALLTTRLREALALAWLGERAAADAILDELEPAIGNPEDRRRLRLARTPAPAA